MGIGYGERGDENGTGHEHVAWSRYVSGVLLSANICRRIPSLVKLLITESFIKSFTSGNLRICSNARSEMWDRHTVHCTLQVRNAGLHTDMSRTLSVIGSAHCI